MMQEHCFEVEENPQPLRIILAALCDRSSRKVKSSPQSMMQHAQMFGVLAKVCKSKLKDPIDRPPSLVKTVTRITDSLISFLSEDSPVVWKGCALSLWEIL